MTDQIASLLRAYLDRREALKRYFALRLRSDEAAEDLVQDIYLKVQSFDRDMIAAIESPVAFLYRLGSNLMLDRIKARERAARRDAAWLELASDRRGDEGVSDEPAADEVLASRQRLQRLLAAVEGLTPPVRRAFRLHKLEGRSHRETAAEMGISKSAVEKHISVALKHLTKQLES